MIDGTVDLLYPNTPSVVGHKRGVEVGRTDHGEQADVVLALSGVCGHINVLVGHIAADQIPLGKAQFVLRGENGQSVAGALTERHLIHRWRTHVEHFKVHANLTHVSVCHLRSCTWAYYILSTVDSG